MAEVNVTPVIPPVGEARPNVEVFSDLVRRCGLERPGDPTDADSLRRALIGDDGPALAALQAHGVVLPSHTHPVQFVDAFPRTTDRRIDLHPDALDREASGLYVYKPDPHPDLLALVTPSTPERTTSTFGQLHRKPVPLQLSPPDMQARGLSDGDRVRVSNDLAEMRCTVVANHELPAGVACHPKGLWSFNTESANTNNALCPDTSADLGGGACYNDARVAVEKAVDQPLG